MPLSIQPADPARPDFAGVVTGIDLRTRVDGDAVAAIEAGLDRFAVLVLHGQPLSDDQQVAFARRFGTLETDSAGHIRKPHEQRLAPEFADVSNLDQDNQVLARDDRRRMFNLGNLLWHSDSSFKPTPAKYSMLSARAIPSAGGDTEFADMRAAWDGLDPATRAEIEDLVCEHSLIHSRGLLGFAEFSPDERAQFTPVPQRLVRRHPVTGRRCLFLASHAGTIRGWPMPEARALLRDLIEHATQPRFVHVHVWSQHDLVIWDNRVTMHRGRRFPGSEVRDMRRTTVADSAPTLEQAA